MARVFRTSSLIAVFAVSTMLAQEYNVSWVGMYPNSAETTSIWLAAPGGPPLIMVFFHGPTGWHKTEWKTSSKFEKGMPGWAEYTSAKARLRRWLDGETGKAEVQYTKVDTSEANTFLVTHMSEDQALQKVVPLGKFDLPRSREHPASEIFLSEHSDIAEKLKEATNGG